MGNGGEAWRMDPHVRRKAHQLASFYGREKYSIDHKGRITIPASMRRDVSERKAVTHFYLTPGFDGCLALYGSDGWQQVENRLRDLPMGKREARAFVRAFLSDVHKVTVDSQGRISVPPSLMSRAGLGKEAVLHGVMDRIEIWHPNRWAEEQAVASDSLEDIAAKLLGGDS